MGSALFFIGISAIVFIISFGFFFQIAPIILGAVFNVMDSLIASGDIDPDWVTTYNEVDSLSQYLVPLIMSLGLVLFVLKILMIAGVRGGD